jgi:hypothetical protein
MSGDKNYNNDTRRLQTICRQIALFGMRHVISKYGFGEKRSTPTIPTASSSESECFKLIMCGIFSAFSFYIYVYIHV